MFEYTVQDTPRQFKIQILTPVHIGVEKESQLVNGVDYIQKDGKSWLVNWNKIFENEDLAAELSRLLLQRNTSEIEKILLSSENQKYLKPAGVSFIGRVFPHIKNSLTKKPIIPGSSIKGAIRSVLLHYLLKESAKLNEYRQAVANGMSNDGTMVKDIFGPIGEKNIMRFIQMGDMEFEGTDFIFSKIYSLRKEYGQIKSGWKHYRNGSNRFFKVRVNGKLKNKFVNTYEVISRGEKTILPIKIEKNKFLWVQRQLNEKNKFKDFQNDFFDHMDDDYNVLFSILNKYCLQYANRELEYYDKYKGAQYQNHLISTWKYIKKETEKAIENKNKYAILRLAMGNGFHGITGDWMHDDHLIDYVGRTSKRNKIKTAKTRKWAFEEKGQDDIEFYPFGFVKIGEF